MLMIYVTPRGVLYLQDIQEAHAGQIVAVFGVDCASGFVSFLLCVQSK